MKTVPGRAVAAALLAGSMLVGNVDPIPTSAATPGSAVNSQHVTSNAPVPSVATGCNHLVFHTRRARRWTNRVHRLTDLTCRQARRVYRRAPSWRDELPTRVRRAAGDRRIPNPAAVGLHEPNGATANTVYCWVWTRERYRAPTFPFGHHTLWSVTVGQTFAYDGHNVVALSRPTVRPDTTGNGFRWFADGPPWGFDSWQPFWARVQRTSERWQKMGTWSIPWVGPTHSTAHLRITVRRDGVSRTVPTATAVTASERDDDSPASGCVVLVHHASRASPQRRTRGARLHTGRTVRVED
jgi:hypothetical protein